MKRKAFWLGGMVAGCVVASAAAAQEYRTEFRPGEMNDRPAGPANEVLVLGTPHLSQLPDSFKPEMANPLVARLVAWGPTAVATEDTAGLVCDAMRRRPSRHAEAYENYCYDTSVAEAATGLDVIAANDRAEDLLADWPQDPEPAQRRELAAVFLAAGEPGSALVQWLRLPAEERRAESLLTAELVSQLDKRLLRENETDLIGARVAANAGLERLWSVDDQSTDMGPLEDEEAFGKAVSAAWDNSASRIRREQGAALDKGLEADGGLMAYYRAMNAPDYPLIAYTSDWGPALAEPSPEGYGRRYVAYWETRNLRMAANIREVLGRRPGTRLLAIVGASHKGYYEAYLSQMRDVQLTDVMPLLRD